MNVQQEQNIKDWLNDEVLVNIIERSVPSKYPVNGIEIKANDSLKLFEYLKQVILQSVDNQVFAELPTMSQLGVFREINNLFQHRNNIQQVVIHIDNLYYQIALSGLEYKLKNYDRFKQPLTEIASLKRKYSLTIKGLNQLNEKVETIENSHNKVVELLENIEHQNLLANAKSEQIEGNLVSSEKIIGQIKEIKQEVETSKEGIIAFKENIEDYKSDITTQKESSKKVVADFEKQRETVSKLISDAEKALGLKSSLGISAALSTQYEEESKPIKRNIWLRASVIFLFIAFVGIVLLIVKFNINGTEIVADSINAIVARVIFVAIAIGGASFSAKQYLNQKRLADNYGYKLVLAKSIVAFAQEIKKHDEAKASEYMNNVLKEINSSPFSTGKEDIDVISSKTIGLLEKIFTFAKSK